jgi:hypothetical protein
MTDYVDADHAHDLVTRRSITGILVILNKTPIRWISKRQKKVETSHNLWIKGSEFLMDPDNPASKYSRQFTIFKDGCPEEWIKWVMEFHEN